MKVINKNIYITMIIFLTALQLGRFVTNIYSYTSVTDVNIVKETKNYLNSEYKDRSFITDIEPTTDNGKFIVYITFPDRLEERVLTYNKNDKTKLNDITEKVNSFKQDFSQNKNPNIKNVYFSNKEIINKNEIPTTESNLFYYLSNFKNININDTKAISFDILLNNENEVALYKHLNHIEINGKTLINEISDFDQIQELLKANNIQQSNAFNIAFIKDNKKESLISYDLDNGKLHIISKENNIISKPSESNDEILKLITEFSNK